MYRNRRNLITALFLCLLLPSAFPAKAGDVVFTEIAKRTASDVAAAWVVGEAIAVDGDTMVVGALQATGSVPQSGAAYVFERNQGGGDAWQEVAKLVASDGGSLDRFGATVGISGDLIVVGAGRNDQSANNGGAAYIFERNQGGANNWGEVVKLTASDAAESDEFGDAVAIHGHTVVVGAHNADVISTDNGALYVFERNQGGADNWGQVKKLTGATSTYYYLGGSVAIEGDTIVAGATGADLVYLYQRNEGGADNWGQVKNWTGSSSSIHLFGEAVSISGDTIVVGGMCPSQPGAAWIFSRNNGGMDNWGEVQRITASDGHAADDFGASVSLSGDRLLVGASKSDTEGEETGAAYVFERNAGGTDNWGETQQLLASDPADYLRFGYSVALDGATAVTGAIGSADYGVWSGAAYVFAGCGANPGEWRSGIEVHASDAASYDSFGSSVSVRGATMIIGAYGDDGVGIYSGSAYVLERNQGGADSWGEVAKLSASDGGASDYFGISVDVSGDTAIVGSFHESSSGTNSGAAYVYQLNHGGADNWGEVVKLTASDVAMHDRFGEWVAIDGDIIVVGAPYNADAGSGTGAAYVFQRNHGGVDNWGEVTKLVASDPQGSSFYGQSVDVSGDVVVVGAFQASSPGGLTGAVYIYSRNLGGPDAWGEMTKVYATDAAEFDKFGRSVAIAGATLLVGAHGDDDLGSESGSAYVFERNQGGEDAWGQVAKLLASDGDADDVFGYRVGLTEGRAVVGAYGAGAYTGAAYVFSRNAGGTDDWDEVAKLTAWDATGESFSRAVAIDGDLVAVGAEGDTDPGFSAGSVYFFYAGCPEFDFGDAIDPDYPTLLASNGARHKLGGSVYMGSAVDMDPDGQPTVDTDGDDLDAEGDDEDGVTFTSPVVTGGSADVDVVASDACLLNAWIDFNDDGDWDDAGEQVLTDEPLMAGTNSLAFAVPLDTSPGEYATTRFRVNTAGGLSYDGEASDGEVEDHEVFIEELDFGDAPDPAYPTLLASDGARHILGGSLILGTLVDAEIDGLPSGDSLGDDANNLDDEDGVDVGMFVVIGTVANIDVTASAAGLLNAWVDFNADGDWLDPGEQVFTDEALVAGSNPLFYSVPPGTVAGALFARFRVDSAGGLSPTGLAADGEVEDHTILAVELDYGDAPDPSYPTLTVSGGAAHILGSGLFLGASVDGEADGQPTALADGDDIGGTDDEDGVIFTSGLGAGLSATVDVTASGAGLLNAWLDFNADGDWSDAGEQVFTDQALVAGVNPLTFPVPVSATLGTSFVRFRLDTGGGLSATGIAPDGEVEDYMVEIVEGPDLEIALIGSSDPAASGRPLTYTITVTNNGPLPATSVTVTDTLAGELIFVSSTPGAPDCTFSVDTLTCDLGTMAPTNTTQITIETVLDHPVWGSFNNTSSVTATELDPIQANNTATVDTTIGLFFDGFESGDLSAWD